MAETVEQSARALILGGGGMTGVAWEVGVLVGLHDQGVNVTDVGLIVGTSAGSVVVAQITSFLGLEELFAHQSRPASMLCKLPLARCARSFWPVPGRPVPRKPVPE